MSDEELKDCDLEEEAKLRAQTAEILEQTWLSHDPTVVEEQLRGIAEAHDFTHFSLGQYRKDAVAALMRLDFEEVKSAQLGTKVMTDLHLAIEYSHLMVLDHLRRLKGEPSVGGDPADIAMERESGDE